MNRAIKSRVPTPIMKQPMSEKRSNSQFKTTSTRFIHRSSLTITFHKRRSYAKRPSRLNTPKSTFRWLKYRMIINTNLGQIALSWCLIRRKTAFSLKCVFNWWNYANNTRIWWKTKSVKTVKVALLGSDSTSFNYWLKLQPTHSMATPVIRPIRITSLKSVVQLPLVPAMLFSVWIGQFQWNTVSWISH